MVLYNFIHLSTARVLIAYEIRNLTKKSLTWIIVNTNSTTILPTVARQETKSFEATVNLELSFPTSFTAVW